MLRIGVSKSAEILAKCQQNLLFPVLAAKSLTEHEALFVQAFEFGGVFLYSSHFHRALGAYAQDTSLCLHAVYRVELGVVCFYAVAQCDTQTGIVAVDKARCFMVAASAAIAFVACEHEHIAWKSLCYGALYGYAVDNAAIEHRLTVDVDYLADVWQTA